MSFADANANTRIIVIVTLLERDPSEIPLGADVKVLAVSGNATYKFIVGVVVQINWCFRQ